MRVVTEVVQALLLVLAAPLVKGIVGRVKARFQKRQGASIWRPYSDLLKLFRKDDLIPPTASWVFSAAPRIVFAVIVSAVAFIPVIQSSSLVGHKGDFILFVYLLAIGRFFLMLGAMDGGSAFGGMGASRDALVSTLAEGPLLLAFVAVSIVAHSPTISGIVQWTLGQNFFDISAVHILAFTTLGIVALAETGRMPVDNPSTHLELTMIHEAMLLEYSGRYLAYMEWGASIKQLVLMTLLANVFFPLGIATDTSPAALGLSALAFGVKLLVLAAEVVLVETTNAKLRLFRVPDLLSAAFVLAALALLSSFLFGRP